MPEVVATGLLVPEGPALLPDGRVLFTEQMAGRLSAYDGTGVQTVALTGGAANSVIVGSDDRLYVCQNGGVVNAWRSSDPRPPGIQRATLDGRVETLATTVDGVATVAPNDLAFGPDGRLYFTDPAQPFDPLQPLDQGRIFALDADGGEVVAEVGGVYCNGIGFAGDGSLLWVESYTRAVCSLAPDGTRRELGRLPEGHVPDGLAVAQDGRIFIASCSSHGVSVVSPEGDYLGLIVLDDDAHPTNCCFEGDALWVTDFGTDFERRNDAGRLWRVETDAVGAPVHAGAL